MNFQSRSITLHAWANTMAGPHRHGAAQLVAGGKVPDVPWRRRAPPTIAARGWGSPLVAAECEIARTPAAKTPPGAPGSTIAPPPTRHHPAVREGTSLTGQRPAPPGAVGAVSNGPSMAASSGGRGDEGVFAAGVNLKRLLLSVFLLSRHKRRQGSRPGIPSLTATSWRRTLPSIQP